MDYASKNPQYERLANYIDFIKTQKEIDDTMRQLGGKVGRLDRQTTLLGKMNLAKNLKPHEQTAALKKL